MKITINSLLWDNLDPRMIESHKAVYDHFGIPIAYTNQNIHHGTWMDNICRETDADLIMFCDADCIPLTKDAFTEAVQYCATTGGFVGPAQASNHYGPPIPSHVFASPAFFMIPKKTYESMGSPSFASVEGRSDVAQEVSRKADELGVPYQCWYPTKYEKGFKTGNPLGYDKLGNYGRYGIGTVYADDKIYHLYEGRTGKNVDRFVQRCNEVVAGTFTSKDMNISNTLLP